MGHGVGAARGDQNEESHEWVLGFEGLMWHHNVRGSCRRSGDEGTGGRLKVTPPCSLEPTLIRGPQSSPGPSPHLGLSAHPHETANTIP